MTRAVTAAISFELEEPLYELSIASDVSELLSARGLPASTVVEQA